MAYKKALFGMGSGLVSWTKCTESAVEDTKRFGLTTFSRPRTVADMNQDFRSMDFFSVAHGVSKGFQGSELLQIFPEAQRMLLAWAKENLETVNSEMARQQPASGRGRMLVRTSWCNRATKNPAKLLLACMKEEEASAGWWACQILKK